MLHTDIERLAASGASADRDLARATFARLREALSSGRGVEWGLSLATPVIVKYRDCRTDTGTELETWIR
ncbi:MAG: hypothetical protein A3F69_01455 [Acidobacteria bacterium RIFCSPLOWO2_12_FULL_66_10]|nr:MAG: hypothetical protein A3F69_01455 [Acidobacteria bacterium RIFCSPLOWO2_12_FULL_66_10]